MKNQLKLIVMILSLTLLVGAALGVAVSAENAEPEISITSYNVAFSGELHLFYALDNSAVAKADAKTIKVGVQLSLDPAGADGRKVYEATASTAKFKDTDYPTFYSFGIPAKNLDDVIYATPYAEYSDGTTVFGDEVSYSVLEYCYQMILVDAPAYAEAGEITADKCKQMQEALRSLLTYGADVQKYLGYETENLPTDYYYIAADGTLNGGAEDAEYLLYHKSEKPETITLTHTGTAPAGMSFCGWKVTYYTGATAAIATTEATTTLTPARSAIYTPVYADAYTTTFDVLDINSANVTTATGMSIVNDEITDKLGAGNRALYTAMTGTTVKNAVSSSSYSAETVAEGVYTFEADMYFSPDICKSSTPVIMLFNDANGKANYQGVITMAADGKLSFKSNVASNGYIIGTSAEGAIAPDQWVNIQIKIYKVKDGVRADTCGVKVTVTGIENEFTLVGDDHGSIQPNTTTVTNGVYAAATNGYEISSVGISWKDVNKSFIYMDNVSLTGDTSGAEKYVPLAE